MIDRAQAYVEVSGIFERTGSETEFSEMGRLKSAGLDVMQDGNPYPLHHKVFIIDGRTVIFGSFNFSENADSSNDENLLDRRRPGAGAGLRGRVPAHARAGAEPAESLTADDGPRTTNR